MSQRLSEQIWMRLERGGHYRCGHSSQHSDQNDELLLTFQDGQAVIERRSSGRGGGSVSRDVLSRSALVAWLATCPPGERQALERWALRR